jgi:FKBP-type peptidyl-prolyl cis-trans isomerase
VTPGFDEAVSGMQRGGQEIVAVPDWLAYGPGGFYGPDRPGTKRLVISPNTMVIYGIEILAQ